jgi:sterol desaturase/sphingolipid hydroxylase (fatty acid hydroxylase superfamily)
MSLISNIIVTPWYHRIHHSLQPEHHNKNYAIFFPFWDVLFKTAHFARDKEFPNTGIKSNIKPNSLRRLLPWPQQ